MKVGYFKYDGLFQDHQKIEAEATKQAQASQGKAETSQFVLMSANLLGSVNDGLAAKDPTKGTDCPFYMMDTEESIVSNIGSENEEACPFNCPLFDCILDERVGQSEFQNEADKVIIE